MKPIPGFNGMFADENGNIYGSYYRNGKPSPYPRLYKPEITRDGYLRVSCNGKNEHIHKLVLLTFVGPCPSGKEACHCNGIRTDNRLSNLRWDRHSTNIMDSINNRTYGNLFIPSEVSQIKKRLRKGETVTQISKSLNVSYRSILNIKNGRSWKSVS